MQLEIGQILDVEDVERRLAGGGYRKVNVVQLTADYSLRRIEDNRLLDIFLVENRENAVRVIIDDDNKIVGIDVFNVASGQLIMPLQQTIIANAQDGGPKGNVIYHIGQTKQKTPFVILRGGGTKDPKVKALIKARGFVFREALGLQRLMAWYGGITATQLRELLIQIRDLGWDVKPSEKLNIKKHIQLPPKLLKPIIPNAPDSRSPDPFGRR